MGLWKIIRVNGNEQPIFSVAVKHLYYIVENGFMMYIIYYLLSNRRDGKSSQRQLGRYRSFKPAKRTLENRDLNEKLHFYHIKPKSKSNNQRPNTGFE